MEKYLMGTYDVIVVGAGHAGCEAGLAAGKENSDVFHKPGSSSYDGL